MATYNPQANYSWTNDVKFELTGEEFGIITTALKALLNTEEAMKYHLLFECNKIVEKTLIKAVQNDLLTENSVETNNVVES